MRVSLKSKLTALISFLVLLVVLATSTLYISSLTRQTLTDIKTQGKYVARNLQPVANHSRAEPDAGGRQPLRPQELRQFVQETLGADPGLASLMESAVGYSPTIYYVAITIPTEHAASQRSEPSGTAHARAAYDELMQAGLFRQLRVIYGPHRSTKWFSPWTWGAKPLGDVRVGVSTLFLRDQIDAGTSTRPDHFASGHFVRDRYRGDSFLSRVAPARNHFPEPRPHDTRRIHGTLRVQTEDEWGILSSKLNLLGEQIRGEKAAFVALQENLDQLFSKLTDGLLLFDQHDRLAVATPVVTRFLNRPTETLIHHPASEVFTTDRPLDILREEAFRDRRSRSWQVVETRGETARVVSAFSSWWKRVRPWPASSPFATQALAPSSKTSSTLRPSWRRSAGSPPGWRMR